MFLSKAFRTGRYSCVGVRFLLQSPAIVSLSPTESAAVPNYLNVARDGWIGLFSYLNILTTAWGSVQQDTSSLALRARRSNYVKAVT